jgi:glycosyltransferase involved in cell wall biosynthesis
MKRDSSAIAAIQQILESNSTLPLVSIGIPVYDAESTIASCIESALAQNYMNLEILISDNASTDATSQICKKYQRSDNRIRYFKQDQNIGALNNFNFVLEESNGVYFRWLGSDDVISSNSISESIKSLERNANFVACAAPTFFDYEYINGQNPIEFKLEGSQYLRIQNFFRQPGRSHGLTYSLIKRDLLLRYPLLGKDFFGWDWCLVLFLLSNGSITFAHSASLILGSNGASSTNAIYDHYGLKGLKRVFPFLKFTAMTIYSGGAWTKGARALLYLNLVVFNLMNLLKEFRIVRYKVSTIRSLAMDLLTKR